MDYEWVLSLLQRYVFIGRHFVIPERPKGESGTHERGPGKLVFMGSGLPLRSSRNDAPCDSIRKHDALETHEIALPWHDVAIFIGQSRLNLDISRCSPWIRRTVPFSER
jgi:hypothetical protein